MSSECLCSMKSLSNISCDTDNEIKHEADSKGLETDQLNFYTFEELAARYSEDLIDREHKLLEKESCIMALEKRQRGMQELMKTMEETHSSEIRKLKYANNEVHKKHESDMTNYEILSNVILGFSNTEDVLKQRCESFHDEITQLHDRYQTELNLANERIERNEHLINNYKNELHNLEEKLSSEIREKETTHNQNLCILQEVKESSERKMDELRQQIETLTLKRTYDESSFKEEILKREKLLEENADAQECWKLKEMELQEMITVLQFTKNNDEESHSESFKALEDKLKRAMVALKQKNEKISDLNNKLGELDEIVKRSQKAEQTLNETVSKTIVLEHKISSLYTENDEHLACISRLNSEVLHLEQELEVKGEQMNLSNSRVNQLELLLEESDHDKQHLTQQCNDYYTTVQSSFSQEQIKSKSLEFQVAELTGKLEDIQLNTKALTDSHEQEKSLMTKQIQDLTNLSEQIRQELLQSNSTFAEYQVILDKLERSECREKQLAEELINCQNSNGFKDGTLQQLSDENSSKDLQIVQLNTEIKQLQEEKHLLEQDHSNVLDLLHVSRNDLLKVQKNLVETESVCNELIERRKLQNEEMESLKVLLSESVLKVDILEQKCTSYNDLNNHQNEKIQQNNEEINSLKSQLQQCEMECQKNTQEFQTTLEQGRNELEALLNVNQLNAKLESELSTQLENSLNLEIKNRELTNECQCLNEKIKNEEHIDNVRKELEAITLVLVRELNEKTVLEEKNQKMSEQIKKMTLENKETINQLSVPEMTTLEITLAETLEQDINSLRMKVDLLMRKLEESEASEIKCFEDKSNLKTLLKELEMDNLRMSAELDIIKTTMKQHDATNPKLEILENQLTLLNKTLENRDTFCKDLLQKHHQLQEVNDELTAKLNKIGATADNEISQGQNDYLSQLVNEVFGLRIQLEREKKFCKLYENQLLLTVIDNKVKGVSFTTKKKGWFDFV